jgi:hypothetical protein
MVNMNTFSVEPRTSINNLLILILQENRENLYGLKDGFKDLRTEIVRWSEEWKERITDESPGFVAMGMK